MKYFIWILILGAIISCKTSPDISEKKGAIKYDYSEERNIRPPNSGESLIIFETQKDYFVRLRSFEQAKISAVYVLATNGLFVYPNNYSLELALYDKKDYLNMKVIGRFKLNYTFLSGQKYKIGYEHDSPEMIIKLLDQKGTVLTTVKST